MKVAYGKSTPTAATDPEVVENDQRIKMSSVILRPGAYLVDWIPWLKYLPWYGRDIKKEFESTKKLNTGQLNRVKEQMVCIYFSIFISRLSHCTAERQGHRPFVREIYAREYPYPRFDRD
jgi:hypothetical protein